ncbi:MAG TPA: response regulator [Caulobacterales bacterium]|jgi:CheY-like chemotaxis protein|nr:response regulator [Caulobacterales bacterium]
MSAERPLEGLSLLVVEDEAMVSMLIEQMFEDMGARAVRCVSSIAEALAAIEQEAPHAAALDVNLRGTPVFPVAEALAARNVPMVFITGYGASGLSAGWAARPVVQKPFTAEALEDAMRLALAPTRPE